MAGERVFIVEDELIVAEDLQRMLGRMGYLVVGAAANGEEAIQKIESARPHLVLMDIRIKGETDGIDVAEHITAEYNIPVIYVTAYADDLTVDRAKGALPAGYILKPFEERSLKASIDVALYRHSMSGLLDSMHEWHGGILENLEEAVVSVDVARRVVYMNKYAERLTGLSLSKALGQKLDGLFAVETGAGAGASPRLRMTTDGPTRVFEYRESAVKDLEGKLIGSALLLKLSPPP